MQGTIKPNRTEVSRSFPVLGFTIRVGMSPAWFEVALATDPRLLHPENREHRTPQNFYSSRGAGPLPAHGGETVYLVPPTVLSRFAGQDRLFYAVATFAGTDRSSPQVMLFAPEATPYITISRSFNGQALRQMIGIPHHRGGLASDGYGAAAPDTMTWAGDEAAPGASQPIPAPISIPGKMNAPVSTNGSTHAAGGKAAAQGFDVPYDDGFGRDFWAKPMDAPPDLPQHDEGIEGPIPDDNQQPRPIAQSVMLALTAPEYPQASRYVPAAPGNYRASRAQRQINRIVIHITDGGPNINGTVGWFQNPDQTLTLRDGTVRHINVSSHYIVGTMGEVVQMVAHNDVAWHANSANGDSIGIEHTANKSRNIWPTDAEYCASAALVNWLCRQYNIPMDRDHILGHSEADPHTTHTDCPNSVWDWTYYMSLVTSGTCTPRPAAPTQGQSYDPALAVATAGYPKTQPQHNGNGHNGNGHSGNGHKSGNGSGSNSPYGQTVQQAVLPSQAQRPYSTGRAAALEAGQSYDINWNDVPLINQTHQTSCWAAAASMVCSWRDGHPVNYNDTARPGSVADYAALFGLVAEAPQSYRIDAFRQMLEQKGPLWLSEAAPPNDPNFNPSSPGYHAIVVTGMYGDNNPDGSTTFVRIQDPWDRTPGTPGNPGPYLNTHNIGSQYILTWQQLIQEYEAVPQNTALDGAMQIMHGADTGGRTIGMGSAPAASQGYAGSLGAATNGSTAHHKHPHGAGNATNGAPPSSTQHQGAHTHAATLADIAPMDAPTNAAGLMRFMADWQRRQTAWKAGVPDTTFFPHSAICHFEMTYPDGLYSGTGFYIGNNTLLTCAHNVIDWATRNEASQIVVTPGKNGAGVEPFGKFTVQRAAWDYHPNYDGTRSFDLAVIRVTNAAPGGQFFDILEELTQSKPSPIIVCGYAARTVDRDKQHLDADMIRTVENETFEYNLQTEPGNSGSPVFYLWGYEDEQRRMSVQDIRIVGVHVAGFDASLNRGCRLTEAKIHWIHDAANQVSTPMPGAVTQAYTPPQVGKQPQYGRQAQTRGLADMGTGSPAAGSGNAAPGSALKEADYSTSSRPNDPEQDAFPAPTATLDHAAMYGLIREVANGHSGNDAYAALSPDTEFTTNGQAAYQKRHFGLGFGLLLFPQESGHLGSVLKLMQQRDAAAFAAAFGPQCDLLLQVTGANTPEDRLKPVENALLWSEPWLTRFRQAGANPTFQAAQNEEAIEQVFRPLLNVLFALGITSDRGLAMALDRAVTRGVGGAIDWIVQTCGPLRTFQHRNYALDLVGMESVHNVQAAAGWTPQDGNFGPETHAALVGSLREQGLLPLPTPADYEARMLAAATGAVLTRLQHLRDSTTLNGTIFRL